MANQNLRAAKSTKQDEFYTQLSDIEEELKHYKQHFKGKVVFCNCDDPYESNFFKYFAMNFNQLGLKRLIATCYDGSPIADRELSLWDDETTMLIKKTAVPHKIIIDEVYDANNDGAVNLGDVEYLLRNDKNLLTRLKGNGDFRSKECKDLMSEADIVCTNPPFSLFREYVNQLVEMNKSFLIIGNKNAITYKECFSLIKENKMWIGYTPMGVDLVFDVPGSYADEIIKQKKVGSGYKIINGAVKARAQAVWFTNLDHKKRHEGLDLYMKYDASIFPKFDYYDAINVDKTSDIPCDYDGVMGVPITFLDKYNPEQFEIIEGLNRYTVLDIDNRNTWAKQNHIHFTTINGSPKYFRILIRKKQ